MEINAGNFNDLLVKAYNKYLDDAGYGDTHFDSMTQEVLTEGTYAFGDSGIEVDGYVLTAAADVGGSEGDGETRYIVFRVSEGSERRYFRYDGYYFDDLEPREVYPQEKVIVVFE